MLREENYLPDMVGVVRHLSVNRSDVLLEILGA